MLKFNQSSPYNIARANDIAKSLQVQRIVSIVNNILGDANATLHLFRESARLFGNEPTDERILSVLKISRFCFAIDTGSELKTSVMKCIPNNMLDPNIKSSHTLCFSDSVISLPSDASDVTINRCVLFHVVKALHEISRVLTSSLLRATDVDNKNDAMNGLVYTDKKRGPASDVGSAFEQLVFGGILVIPNMRIPFDTPLMVNVLPNAIVAPRAVGGKPNINHVQVSDALVKELLAKLTKWRKGTALPDLNLMNSDTTRDRELVAIGTKRTRVSNDKDERSKRKKADVRASGLQETSEFLEFVAGEDDAEEQQEQEEQEGEEDEEYEALMSIGLGLCFSAEQVRNMQKGIKY